MEEPSELGPRSKRMRLEAEEAERAPLNSQAREEVLARCNVGTFRGIVPEARSVPNSVERYHVVSHALTVRRVECRDAWSSTLTKEEKLYGHHFSQAAWAGARICAYQSSQESPAILSILCMVFSGEPVGVLEKRSYAAGITEQEWKYLGAFAACFFTNMGNYLAFGGTKFIPGISEQKLAVIINLCTLEGERKERLVEMWNSTKAKIYSLKEGERQLGIPPRGTSMYYHPSIRVENIDLVQEWMAQRGMEGWNTRIWRNEDEMEREGLPLSQLRVASSLIIPTEVHTYKDNMIEIVYGDFHQQLQEVVEHLEKAFEFANGLQKDMLIEFIEYFKTGSIEAHKRAQRQWVSVRDSPVESNIGFIETYRDPTGIRAEFEGFVATVDKDHGFKNVVLQNILPAHEDVGKVTFLGDGDQDVFQKQMESSLHVQIACHELLGHGSGKIFTQKDDGIYNYKYGEVMDPFTSEPVVKCYAPGQTFDSVFGSLSSAFEECRADCVALYLSSNALVLKIFGHTGSEAEDVVYVNWLLMVRAGLVALEFFNPKTGNWSQPHMQARFAILRVLLKAAEAESLQLESLQSESPDGESEAPFLQLVSQDTDVLICLTRSKIHAIGMPALGDFLSRLQVYKSTADVDSARTLFNKMCEVPDSLIALRRIVLIRKTPRPLLVQVTTALDDNCEEGVSMKDYPETLEGVIESFVERFQEWMLTC